MAKECKHEECTYPVWAKGYCKKHQYLRTDKKIKSISPFSEKMLEALKVYKVERLKYLNRHPMCQAKIDGCTGDSQQIHHKKGRIGDLLTDPTHFLAVCHQCHVYIENNPIEAKEKGWSLTR
jgi:hypothetical protein